MHYLKFIQQLFESGRVVIESPTPANDKAIKASVEWLADFESQWRENLSGSPPAFDPEIASWAGVNFYRACQLLMHRDIADSANDPGFPKQSFSPTNVSSHYNVDLVFRFLPDLRRFAKGLEPTEVVVQRIAAWCVQWPLSSVGVANLDEETSVAIEGFVDDPSLLQLYVDRIVRRVDLSRLDDPRVAGAVRNSIGDSPDLAKPFRMALVTNATNDSSLANS